MEEFFPSEIARLVLGYLEEVECQKSWKTFVRENSSLSEYFHLYQKGKVYSTNVNGKSLLDILKEYCYLKREAMMKNQEDFSKKGESALTLEDCITRNKNSAGRIVEDAVDHVLHQYFPSICKSKSDACNDNTAVYTSETEKCDCENVKDLCVNETDKLDAVDENTGCGPPQITEVTSLGDVNSFNAGTSLDSKKDSSENGSVCVLGIVKSEPNNDIVVTDIVSSTQDKSIDASNDAILYQKHESMDSCNVDDELDAQNKISSMSEKDSSLSDLILLSERSDLSSKPDDVMELAYLDNHDSHSDHNIERIQSQNNTALLCDSNNSDAKQNSYLNAESLVVQGDNVINTLNSSNNPSTFILTTNSLPSQCGTVPLSTVPTYIVPSYPSNNCFLQNNTPYRFVINSPNGIPLTVSSVPVNLAKPTLTASDSAESIFKLKTYSNQGISSQDSANKVSSTAAVAINNKVSETVTVNEKVSAKQKKDDKSSGRKRTNTSEVASKKPAKKKPSVNEIKHSKCQRSRFEDISESNIGQSERRDGSSIVVASSETELHNSQAGSQFSLHEVDDDIHKVDDDMSVRDDSKLQAGSQFSLHKVDIDMSLVEKMKYIDHQNEQGISESLDASKLQNILRRVRDLGIEKALDLLKVKNY